jgi:F420-dependent oxidoreductase-like protein
MQVCLMIEGQENVTWDQWVAIARACEEQGFDALFRSDHYRSLSGRDADGTLDAWTTLAALAARTERIRLGTLVSPVTFRHPSLLAKSVVTADHVSGGRVELGMGAGWHEGEHRAYGFPFPPPAERLAMLGEQVEIVHRLWDRDEETVTFQGSHYRLDACPSLPKPFQDPHPNLILGGEAGPRAARLAARWADEYNVNFSTAETCLAARHRLHDACERVGRDPSSLRFSLMTGTLVGENGPELDARARRLMDLRGQQGEPDAFLSSLGEAWIIGTPELVLDELSRLAEVGVERVMLQHLIHDDLDAVALIGQRIIPEAATI